MSYSLTDAGEADMRAELKVLEQLNEDIDQAASEAIKCDTLGPKVKQALDLAWFLVEDAMREAGTSSCGHVVTMRGLSRSSIKRNPCQCCSHYLEVGLETDYLRGHL